MVYLRTILNYSMNYNLSNQWVPKNSVPKDEKMKMRLT